MALTIGPWVLVGLLLAANSATGSSALATADELAISDPMPSVYRLRPEWLVTTRAQIDAGDKVRSHALAGLVKLADDAVSGSNYSVTDNVAIPPSGDNRDYMSVGPYWWPNPAADDGLPWIRRDGQVNRAARGANSDSHIMNQMVGALRALALAYFFTGDDVYVTRATEILQAFFLNESTAMNPNLNFGQGIPGRTEGRGIGIIESRRLMDVVDAVGLLETSPAFPAQVKQSMQTWFADFLHWLQSSPQGRDEQREHNNHGTFYDAQLVHFALFVGETSLAKQTLLEVAKRRIKPQLNIRGEQPHELERTRPFHYSTFNLEAFYALALLGEKVGVDLWRYQLPSQGSSNAVLRQALDYLNSYQHPDQKTGLVETDADRGKLQALNHVASLVYDPVYNDEVLALLRQGQGNLQCLLLFPMPDSAQLSPHAGALLKNKADSLCNY